MTIERVQGFEDLYEVSCDGCSDGHTVDAASFQAVVRSIKGDGWLITKENGEFIHLCGSCREERQAS